MSAWCEKNGGLPQSKRTVCISGSYLFVATGHYTRQASLLNNGFEERFDLFLPSLFRLTNSSLATSMTRTEKLLAELIALPGVNPAFLPPLPRAPVLKLNFNQFCPDAPISSRGCGQKIKSARPSYLLRTSTPLARMKRASFLNAKTDDCTVAARATRKVQSPPCSPRFANWRIQNRVRSKRKSFSPDWLTRNTRKPVRARL